MYILVTYDVNTTSPGGERRLRRVAKICVEHGQRVQNSVFECLLDPAQFELMKYRLLDEIDESKDSLRFYKLGKSIANRVEHFGSKETYNPEGFLLV